MSAGPTGFLVNRRDDGFGDVFPLVPGQTCTLGRAATNRIVLKDDLCSREHAEVSASNGHWQVRDLGSLNGTRVNGERLNGSQCELSPGDELSLGRTQFLFVEDMSQLPELPTQTAQPGGEVSIKKRLGQTHFQTPIPAPPTPEESDGTETVPVASRHALSRDLSLLYRLALDMGSAQNFEELCRIVLDALLEAIPAEVGAILTVAALGEPDRAVTKNPRSQELQVRAHRHRDPSVSTYTPVSEYVSKEVLAMREAILAENVARDRYLRNRESLEDLGATSLICAPIVFGERVQGLIHLYCTNPQKALDAEDLEFAVAVAKQMGSVIHQMQSLQSLSIANRTLQDQLKVESELVGDSPAMKSVEQQIGRVAGTNATVLIRGESGSGKELVARAIHFSSQRREGPFVCLNCAALTETLAGERTVRPREGVVHRGDGKEDRQVRGVAPRDDLSG